MSAPEKKVTLRFILYTAWAWFTVIFFTIAYLPIVLTSLALCPFLDHDRRLILPVNQSWCRLLGSIQPLWRHRIIGVENIDPEESYVVASNHLSAADIVLLGFLDVPFRWVAKQAIYFVPIFGWQLWALGHLSIRRGSKRSRRRFMARAVRTLHAGMSILIFLEGTRSRTGDMRPFKPGAFLIARAAGKPLLPVVISGTYNAMPPNSILLRNRICGIFKVLEPIRVDGKTDEEIDEVMTELRERMIREKEELDRESEVLHERWLLSLKRR